jgi:hypothetical protein
MNIYAVSKQEMGDGNNSQGTGCHELAGIQRLSPSRRHYRVEGE